MKALLIEDVMLLLNQPMSRHLNTSHIGHCENKTPLLSHITKHKLSTQQKTPLEEEGIIMNKILALCIGLLVITLPFSSQQVGTVISFTLALQILVFYNFLSFLFILDFVTQYLINFSTFVNY